MTTKNKPQRAAKAKPTPEAALAAAAAARAMIGPTGPTGAAGLSAADIQGGADNVQGSQGPQGPQGPAAAHAWLPGAPLTFSLEGATGVADVDIGSTGAALRTLYCESVNAGAAPTYSDTNPGGTTRYGVSLDARTGLLLPAEHATRALGSPTLYFDQICVYTLDMGKNTLYAADPQGGASMSMSYDLVNQQTMLRKGTTTLLSTAVPAETRTLSVDTLNLSGLSFTGYVSADTLAQLAGSGADPRFLADALTRAAVAAVVLTKAQAAGGFNALQASYTALRDLLQGRVFVVGPSSDVMTVVDDSRETPALARGFVFDIPALEDGAPAYTRECLSLPTGLPASGTVVARTTCFLPSVLFDHANQRLEVHWYWFEMEYADAFVTGDLLASGAMGTDALADLCVDSLALAANAAGAAALASSAVSTSALASGAVGTQALAAGLIASSAGLVAADAPPLPDADALSSAQRAPFTRADLATYALLAATSSSSFFFSESGIQDGAVAAQHLADASVSVSAIADGALAPSHLAANVLQLMAVGAQGPQGRVGDAGLPGPSGATGDTGALGPQGPDSLLVGAAGDTGATNSWFTGESGLAGSAGPQGPQGYQGTLGDTGAQGRTGATGASPAGLAGPAGPAGRTGDTGTDGPTGFDGASGADKTSAPIGATGVSGSAGFAGAASLLSGPQGYLGAQGPQGTSGPAAVGAAGDAGFTGDRGTAGAQGRSGAIGALGPRGALGHVGATSTTTGETGVQGPQGFTGGIGNNGSLGDRGSTGEVGPQGAQGPWAADLVGAQGVSGFTGATGDQGIQGPTGYTGNAGLAGMRGEASLLPGDTGTQGPMGDLGDRGMIGRVGDTGAQGLAGHVGATGSEGDAGPVGPDASDRPGEQGPQGPVGPVGVLRGAQGAVGPTGESALPMLERRGPQGLSGDTGDLGDHGMTGGTGPTSEDTGAAGFQGLDGTVGAVGAIGRSGAQGAAGAAGDTGFAGPAASDRPGFQGMEGAQGPQGGLGFLGAAGDQGSAGQTGSTGSQGPVSEVAGATGSAGPVGTVQGTQGPTGPRGPASTVPGAAGHMGDTGAQGPQGFTGEGGSLGAAGLVGSMGATSLETGATGAAGAAGAAGVAGDRGQTGSQGVQGFTGPTSTVAGAAGFTGPTGERGTSGPQGLAATDRPGVDGAVGPTSTETGTQGVQGRVGDLGTQGPQGPTSLREGGRGVTGSTGTQGPTGAVGDLGERGAQGEVGALGAQGPQGFQGPTSTVAGDAGFTGATGATSEVTGAQGPQGWVGEAGDQGLRGQTGNTGAQGAQGPLGAASVLTGTQGFTGAEGAAGHAGFTGSTGATGTDGQQGAAATDRPGVQGAQGPAASLFFGETGYTGAQGPQGPQGPRELGARGWTGEQGAQGAIGWTGETGPTSTVAGDAGFTGNTGSQGRLGEVGALGAQGFTGEVGPTSDLTGFTGYTGPTGARSSLVADTGATGAQGTQGPLSQGPSGFTGEIGAQGPQGVLGMVGAQGTQGFAQTQAPTGDTGQDGPQGPQGRTGFVGPQGVVGANDGPTGRTGSTGTQGPQGYTGGQSAPGATGATGGVGLSGGLGPQGPQGWRGQTGADGAAGATGRDGMAGPTGAAASASELTGPTGATGAAGLAADVLSRSENSNTYLDPPPAALLATAVTTTATLTSAEATGAWAGAATGTYGFSSSSAASSWLSAARGFAAAPDDATDDELFNSAWVSADAVYSAVDGSYLGTQTTSYVADGASGTLSGEFMDIQLPQFAELLALRMRAGRARSDVALSEGAYVDSLPGQQHALLDPVLGAGYTALLFPGSATAGETRVYRLTLSNADNLPVKFVAVGGGGGAPQTNQFRLESPQPGGAGGEVAARSLVLTTAAEGTTTRTFVIVVGAGGLGTYQNDSMIGVGGAASQILCLEDRALHMTAAGGGFGSVDLSYFGRMRGSVGAGVGGTGYPYQPLQVQNWSTATEMITTAAADVPGLLGHVGRAANDTELLAADTTTRLERTARRTDVSHSGGGPYFCSGGGSGGAAALAAGGAGTALTELGGPEFACFSSAVRFGGGGGGVSLVGCMAGGAGGGGGGALYGVLRAPNGGTDALLPAAVEPRADAPEGFAAVLAATGDAAEDWVWSPFAGYQASNSGVCSVDANADGSRCVVAWTTGRLGRSHLMGMICFFPSWGFTTQASYTHVCVPRTPTGTEADTAYAAAATGGRVFVSRATDSGAGWLQVGAETGADTSAEFQAALPSARNEALGGVACSADGLRVYLWAPDAATLYVSTDALRSLTNFTSVSVPSLPGGTNPVPHTAFRVRCSADGTVVLLSGGRGALFLGASGSWSSLAANFSEGGTATLDFTGAAILETAGSGASATLFACTASSSSPAGAGQIWRSTDLGTTWTCVYTTTDARDVVDIRAAAGGFLVAGLQGRGVIRSSDGGTTWSAPQNETAPVFDNYRAAYGGTLTGLGFSGAFITALALPYSAPQRISVACTFAGDSAGSLLCGGPTRGAGGTGAPCSGGGGGGGSIIVRGASQAGAEVQSYPNISCGGSGFVAVVLPTGFLGSVTSLGGAPLTEARPFFESDSTLPVHHTFADTQLTTRGGDSLLVPMWLQPPLATGTATPEYGRPYNLLTRSAVVNNYARSRGAGSPLLGGLSAAYQHVLPSTLGVPDRVSWNQYYYRLPAASAASGVTFCCWARLDPGARSTLWGDGGVLMKLYHDANSDACALFLSESTRRVQCFTNSGGASRSFPNAADDGLWHHYAWSSVADPALEGTGTPYRWNLYLDGALVDSAAMSTMHVTNNADLLFVACQHSADSVGQNNDRWNGFTGFVADMRVYLRALAAAEVALLYDLRAAAQPAAMDTPAAEDASFPGDGARLVQAYEFELAQTIGRAPNTASADRDCFIAFGGVGRDFSDGEGKIVGCGFAYARNGIGAFLPGFTAATRSVSLACWVRVTTGAAAGALFSFMLNMGAQRWSLYVSGTTHDRLSLRVHNNVSGNYVLASESSLIAVDSLDNNTWSHLMLVLGAGANLAATLRLYQNGTLRATLPAGDAPAVAAAAAATGGSSALVFDSLYLQDQPSLNYPNTQASSDFQVCGLRFYDGDASGRLPSLVGAAAGAALARPLELYAPSVVRFVGSGILPGGDGAQTYLDLAWNPISGDPDTLVFSTSGTPGGWTYTTEPAVIDPRTQTSARITNYGSGGGANNVYLIVARTSAQPARTRVSPGVQYAAPNAVFAVANYPQEITSSGAAGFGAAEMRWTTALSAYVTVGWTAVVGAGSDSMTVSDVYTDMGGQGYGSYVFTGLRPDLQYVFTVTSRVSAQTAGAPAASFTLTSAPLSLTDANAALQPALSPAPSLRYAFYADEMAATLTDGTGDSYTACAAQHLDASQAASGALLGTDFATPVTGDGQSVGRWVDLERPGMFVQWPSNGYAYPVLRNGAAGAPTAAVDFGSGQLATGLTMLEVHDALTAAPTQATFLFVFTPTSAGTASTSRNRLFSSAGMSNNYTTGSFYLSLAGAANAVNLQLYGLSVWTPALSTSMNARTMLRLTLNANAGTGVAAVAAYNGAQFGSANRAATTLAGTDWRTFQMPVDIGGSLADAGSGFRGSISEALVYDFLLSETDIQRLEGALAAKWGVALAADHPYATTGAPTDSTPLALLSSPYLGVRNYGTGGTARTAAHARDLRVVNRVREAAVGGCYSSSVSPTAVTGKGSFSTYGFNGFTNWVYAHGMPTQQLLTGADGTCTLTWWMNLASNTGGNAVFSIAADRYLAGGLSLFVYYNYPNITISELKIFPFGNNSFNIAAYFNMPSLSGGQTFSYAMWHHYAIVFSNGQPAQLYIDGKACGVKSGLTRPNLVIPASYTNPGLYGTYLGAAGNVHVVAATQPVNAHYDEICVFPAALSAAQINTLYRWNGQSTTDIFQ